MRTPPIDLGRGSRNSLQSYQDLIASGWKQVYSTKDKEAPCQYCGNSGAPLEKVFVVSKRTRERLMLHHYCIPDWREVRARELEKTEQIKLRANQERDLEICRAAFDRMWGPPWPSQDKPLVYSTLERERAKGMKLLEALGREETWEELPSYCAFMVDYVPEHINDQIPNLRRDDGHIRIKYCFSCHRLAEGIYFDECKLCGWSELEAMDMTSEELAEWQKKFLPCRDLPSTRQNEPNPE